MPTFPNSPVDREISGNHIWDASVPGWRMRTKYTTPRQDALDLLARAQGFWHAADAAAGKLANHGSAGDALDATLTGLTPVTGPALAFPVTAGNSLYTTTYSALPADGFTCEVKFATPWVSPGSIGVIYGYATSLDGGTGWELRHSSGGLLTLTYHDGVAFQSLIGTTLVGALGARLIVSGTTATLQTWNGTAWVAAGGGTLTRALAAITSGKVSVGSYNGGAGLPARMNLSSLIVYSTATPSTIYAACSAADIANTAATATTLVTTDGPDFTVTRATTGRMLQIVPRGTVLVNTNPTVSTNQASYAPDAAISASEDGLLVWSGQLGNPLGAALYAYPHGYGMTSASRLQFYRSSTGQLSVQVSDGVTEMFFPIATSPTSVGRGTLIASLRRGTGLLHGMWIEEDTGVVQRAQLDVSTVGALSVPAAGTIGRGVELTSAAGFAIGIDLPEITDDVAKALHRMLALGEWESTARNLARVFGGLTEQEREGLIGAVAVTDDIKIDPTLFNNAVGRDAQRSLTTGSFNNAVGYAAQYSLTTGSNNNAVGYTAQYSLTTGSFNNAVGYAAQYSLTTGSNNNAVGRDAQRSLTTGSNNNAVGYAAQYSLTTGSYNNAVGYAAQYSLTTGSNNNAVGYAAQYSPGGVAANAHTTAARGTSVGHESGLGSTAQDNDITTVGHRALATGTGAASFGSGAHAAYAGSVALGMGTITARADSVHVGTRDVEIGGNATKGVLMRSPDGTLYRLTIANGGTVSVVAA